MMLITLLRKIIYFILMSFVFLLGILGSKIICFVLTAWALLIALFIKLKKEKLLKLIFADFATGSKGYSIKQALISAIGVFVVGVIGLLFF
ncbi:hypothetical protein [Priestia koreensis]|uniref:hypothetical protein n=1 Tax=Priestia koreensis TaxID=284581 RepID=UPI001F56E986|nr:hypothetical protein [Priestia koreensis]UNL83243.1 hypothetical protein IE339_13770 [Priestia koreensis]